MEEVENKMASREDSPFSVEVQNRRGRYGSPVNAHHYYYCDVGREPMATVVT